MVKSDDATINNLKLILTEAKNSRKELLDHSNRSADKIWESMSFLILLTGVYFTVATFMFGEDKTILYLPLSLSIILIIVALIISFYNILPKNFLLTPNPDTLYELRMEENKKILTNLVETYLIHNKKYIVFAEKKAFVKEKINIILLSSIIEYSFFILFCFVNKHATSFNIVSVLFVLILLHYFIHKIKQENNEIKSLESELNI